MRQICELDKDDDRVGGGRDALIANPVAPSSSLSLDEEDSSELSLVIHSPIYALPSFFLPFFEKLL
jgi:hypothetical protein